MQSPVAPIKVATHTRVAPGGGDGRSSAAATATPPSSEVPPEFAGLLSRQQVKDALRVWREFDTDESNAIDRGELADMLQHLGLDVDEATLNDLFVEVDTDGSGAIEWKEFLQVRSVGTEWA